MSIFAHGIWFGSVFIPALLSSVVMTPLLASISFADDSILSLPPPLRTPNRNTSGPGQDRQPFMVEAGTVAPGGMFYSAHRAEQRQDSDALKPDKFTNSPSLDADGVRHFANGKHFDLSRMSIEQVIGATRNADPSIVPPRLQPTRGNGLVSTGGNNNTFAVPSQLIPTANNHMAAQYQPFAGQYSGESPEEQVRRLRHEARHEARQQARRRKGSFMYSDY